MLSNPTTWALWLNDPMVWLLIVVLVVFLFGASKIPQLARAFGEAKREFEKAASGATTTAPPQQQATSTAAPTQEDPLIIAAKREGISVEGKTREQIVDELAWKIKQR